MQGYVYLALANSKLPCLTYRCVQLTSSIKENPRLRAAAEELRKAGIKVGDAVGEALRTMEESEVMRAVSISAVTIRQAGLNTTKDLEGFFCNLFHNREVNRAYPEDRGVQDTRGNIDGCSGRQW